LPKPLSSLIISVLIAAQPVILSLVKLWNLLRSLTRGSSAGALGLCLSFLASRARMREHTGLCGCIVHLPME